jgi:CheY-like chemotaxis protein
VALTASVLSGEQDRYIAVGMNDYVAKPIDPAALAAALRRTAGARREPPAERATAQGLGRAG